MSRERGDVRAGAVKRADAVHHLRYAGYHNDSASWTRLYIENRIGYAKAKEAWREGQQMKTNGVPCTCSECRK